MTSPLWHLYSMMLLSILITGLFNVSVGSAGTDEPTYDAAKLNVSASKVTTPASVIVFCGGTTPCNIPPHFCCGLNDTACCWHSHTTVVSSTAIWPYIVGTLVIAIPVVSCIVVAVVIVRRRRRQRAYAQM